MGIISIVLGVIEFILIWLVLYAEYEGEDIIYITKNKELNWFFMHFLIPHAVMYEALCERINERGLALLLIGLSIITYPVTIIMSIIGGIVMLLRLVWRGFCVIFAREKEIPPLPVRNYEVVELTSNTDENGWHYWRIINWSKEDEKD